MMASLTDAHIAVGDRLGIDIGLFNESFANVRSVDVVLKQTGSWSAQGAPTTSTVELCRRHIRASELPTSAQPTRRAPGASLYTAVNFMGHVANELTHLDLVCPASRSTFKGKMGSVTPALVVTTQVGFCGAKPIFEVPVIMYGAIAPGVAHPQVGQAFSLPLIWAPISAPSVVINVAPAVST